MHTKPVIKRTISRGAVIFACAAFGFAGGKAMAPHWFGSPGPAKGFVLPEATPLPATTAATSRPVARGGGPTTGPSKSVVKGAGGDAERHGSVGSGD